jgi:phage FluMu gp28-like protein
MKIREQSFFLPYQIRWIRDDSRLKIMEKARQIGMTLATAYGAVRKHAMGSGTTDTWIASRDELQARLFIDDCRHFAKTLAPACKFFGGDPIAEEKIDTPVALKFSDGTAIGPLSSSVNAQAGKRGSRILDEFALHSDQRNLYAIALPGITWGGRLEILSTHRGSNNFFNALIREVLDGGNPKRFSHHRVTLQDALEQGFLARLKVKMADSDGRRKMSDGEYFDAVRDECPDEESFLQEYMCVPANDGGAFIAGDAVAACEYPCADGRRWELCDFTAVDGAYYLGVDVGRSHDLTVFWLLELRDNALLTRRVDCMKNAPFSSQERHLGEFFSLRGLRRVCIDRTGIGLQFCERACEAFGSNRVEGITFTNAVKERLAYGLRRAFEDGTVKIPGDDFIRADIRSVRRETTFAGNVRFAGDRRKDGHADRFWALAMAIHAAGVTDGTHPICCERIGRAREVIFL